MSTRITITPEQRDALYEQTLDHLSGITDLWTAITNEDFETADRLGQEFDDGLRLILHDLGWGNGPAGERVMLTLPLEDLHRIFTRLRQCAENPREFDEREEAEEAAHRFRDRTRLVTEACERVLDVVARHRRPECRRGPNARVEITSETPWRERIELGLKVTDELGPHWVALDGEDFLERIELAGSLTLELAEDWAAVFCYCARAEQPVSATEVAAALKLDRDVVARCLVRLDEERLLEATAQTGTYVFAAGRRASVDQTQQPSAGR